MILLTGANGFVGKHFLRELTRVHKKSEIVLLTSAAVDGYQCIIYKDWTFNQDLQRAIQSISPSLVFHLGATTLRTKNETDFRPATANILFTNSLLQSVPSSARFIFVSTLDVYGKVDGIVTEATPCSPATLYGYSKLYCERMIETWAKANGSTIQILRLGHVYGPGEEQYEKFLPVALKRAAVGELIEIWGDGSELRSFIHVGDACRAILQASELAGYAGPINISGSGPVTINEVVSMIKSLVPDLKVRYSPSRSAATNFVFDTTKMKSLLGEQQVTLETGLKEELEHFKGLTF